MGKLTENVKGKNESMHHFQVMQQKTANCAPPKGEHTDWGVGRRKNGRLVFRIHCVCLCTKTSQCSSLHWFFNGFDHSIHLSICFSVCFEFSLSVYLSVLHCVSVCPSAYCEFPFGKRRGCVNVQILHFSSTRKRNCMRTQVCECV